MVAIGVPRERRVRPPSRPLFTAGPRGPADVVFVLLLLQAAAGLLAAAGELVLMTNPLYAVMPVVRAAVLAVLGGRIVRGRRWAAVTAIVLEWLGLLGVGLGLLAGLLPGLAPSVTLTGLLTEVALPAAVITLCSGLLARRPGVAP